MNQNNTTTDTKKKAANLRRLATSNRNRADQCDRIPDRVNGHVDDFRLEDSRFSRAASLRATADRQDATAAKLEATIA